MGKKKRIDNKPWCWYCEREFEDDKVLISHQKAKHFRCSYCPRRLNTANGLAVHIQQVHKLEADRIENALPGRSTFDIEIFGMEGIPPPDKLDYEQRKAEAKGINKNKKDSRPTKRARIYKGVINPEDFAIQLQAHRAIMSGMKLPAPPNAFPTPPPPAPGISPIPPPPFVPPLVAPSSGPPPPGTSPFPPDPSKTLTPNNNNQSQTPSN